MRDLRNQTLRTGLVRYSKPARTLRCIACGTDRIKPGRRYCTKECRRQINWVLSLSKGLLKTFNARYAAFYFTKEQVILDVLPVWSKEISRFIFRRIAGNKPAEDLKNLILQSGEKWYNLVENKTSRSFASLFLLSRNQNKKIDPNSIRPLNKSRLRLSKVEKSSLRILQLEREDLSRAGNIEKIKSAYKRMAKRHHPDVGGNAERFKELNNAHKQMLLWAENPQYTSRRALQNCWSYDGVTNRWAPPL